MNDFITQFLSEKNIGYAIFDHDLNLIEHNKNLSSFLITDTKEKSLFELFPEFIGLEKEIEKVKLHKKNKLSVEKINKYNKSGELVYFDYLLIPYAKGENKLVLILTDSSNESKLIQKVKQQQNEINILKESLSFLKSNSINNILGNSSAIKSVRKFITKISSIKESTILITGESGTGKTLIARAIHNLSNETEAPFIEINCASIPDTLLEAEIFGFVKGAFTSAVDNKKGLIEEAEGGTLFLDEIGELPLSLQPKFLSFLETKKFRPIGSTKEISVNTRIITATNRDLESAVKSKEFRQDLYYRINVVSIKIPSLYERKEDILILANFFINHFGLDFNKTNIKLSKKSEEKLKNYNWPGNIRELRNVIERALIFCENNLITEEDILINSFEVSQEKNNDVNIPDDGFSLTELEKSYLQHALKKSKGNQSKAAKLLDLSLDTFRYRLKKFNIS